MFKEVRKTIKKQDPSIHSLFEAFFHPWFLSWLFYKISRFFYQNHFYSIARFLSNTGKRRTGIEIHPGAYIGKNVFIDHGSGVVIGETSIIEDDVIIFQNVTLGGRGNTTGKRHPTIKKGTLIGAGAKVLGNITVGEYSKIGANSVVLTDIPSNSTVVGIPGRVI